MKPEELIVDLNSVDPFIIKIFDTRSLLQTFRDWVLSLFGVVAQVNREYTSRSPRPDQTGDSDLPSLCGSKEIRPNSSSLFSFNEGASSMAVSSQPIGLGF